MATPPKAPPRFVPTLTEVVQVPGAPQAALPVEPRARTTVMAFCVSVPVLSEQMTVTDPRVSTAGSLRTRALRRAIRRAPRARAVVAVAEVMRKSRRFILWKGG